MPKATWNGVTIAESETFETVEGNTYFPPESIKKDYFKASSTHSTCPWKGEASYYTIEVDGKQNPDAAWYYPQPKDAAKNIKGYVAFWKGVEVTSKPAPIASISRALANWQRAASEMFRPIRRLVLLSSAPISGLSARGIIIAVARRMQK